MRLTGERPQLRAMSVAFEDQGDTVPSRGTTRNTLLPSTSSRVGPPSSRRAGSGPAARAACRPVAGRARARAPRSRDIPRSARAARGRSSAGRRAAWRVGTAIGRAPREAEGSQALVTDLRLLDGSPDHEYRTQRLHR